MTRRWGNLSDLSATIGPDGFSRWEQPVRRGYRMRCCDCGLVHIIDFRIFRKRVQFRVARDNRATAAIRSAWMRAAAKAEIGTALLKAITKWARAYRAGGRHG